jgi:hypothetical protein
MIDGACACGPDAAPKDWASSDPRTLTSSAIIDVFRASPSDWPQPPFLLAMTYRTFLPALSHTHPRETSQLQRFGCHSLILILHYSHS